MVVAILVVIATVILGMMRANIADMGISLHTVMYAIEFLRNYVQGMEIYSFDAISPTATTLANVIHLIQSGTLDFYYGKSYLEFIPRTPPQLLYPGRPVDLSWMFPDYGLSAAGGIFELAEGYLNFGLFGAFFIPLIIAFLISRTYWQAFYNQSLWRYFLLFSFLPIWMRGVFNQTFAYYKAFVTSIILYFLFMAITQLIGARLGKPRTNYIGYKQN